LPDSESGDDEQLSERRRAGTVDPRFGSVATQAAPADIAWRYSRRAIFGERAKWLPPYRLVPSFASADGQTAVYRRRSQIVLTDDSDNTHVVHDATVKLDGNEYKVRIDQYGYARLVRPTRSQQHVDPLSNTVDGAADMEREAALAVCKHLNEHVDGIALAHRWTPSPATQLVPTSVRSFSEPQPEPPRKVAPADGKGEAKVRRSAMEDYLDARAGWLARRFAWESGQRALQERGARAAQGDATAMQEHLLNCLNDVLWPVPIKAAYEFRGTSEVRIDVLMPGFDVLPDREAVIAYGNRVSVQRMTEVNKVKLFDRHALGLTLRLLGEVFAALPTVQRATVTALQQPDHRPARYIVSAQVDRKPWSHLYANGGVIADSPEPALAAIKARYNLTGLGAFMAIEPF
jgi:hypothetical protein